MISSEAIDTGAEHDNDELQYRNNVGSTERWLSLIIGGGLLLYAVRQGWHKGVLPSLAGSALAYRGATGRCALYKMAGINTSEQKRAGVSVPHGQGIKVERSIAINNKSPEELYGFWRNPENLARFMKHVVSVQSLGGERSHWKMKSLAGTEFEWDAEIINDKPNELIAWRSLAGADVDHAGSVHFQSDRGGRGTRVKVIMEYRPPAGKMGVALAKLFGEEPEHVIDEDLRRFKQLMEAGEIASVERQPSGLAQH